MVVVLVLVAVVLIAVAVVLAIGLRLPVAHSVSRAVSLRRTPAEVYAIIGDFASTATWRPEVVRVELLPPVDGHARFREVGEHGAVTYEVAEQLPPHRLITRIVDQNLGYSGTWTYNVEAEGTGARLEIREDGKVTNLFFRFMARFVFGHTATIDSYLASLTKRMAK